MPLLPFPRPYAWGVGLAMLFALPGSGMAEPITPKLTPKLDRLLREEMQAVQEAMNAVHTGIVTGDHSVVAEKAQAIHDSFILKRALSDADRRALKAAVPPRFLALDQRFHQQAASLAQAARKGRTQQELKLFRRMTRGCVQCHAEYVGDRFPELEPPGKEE